jgi:hypothetical protein
LKPLLAENVMTFTVTDMSPILGRKSCHSLSKKVRDDNATLTPDHAHWDWKTNNCVVGPAMWHDEDDPANPTNDPVIYLFRFNNHLIDFMFATPD